MQTCRRRTIDRKKMLSSSPPPSPRMADKNWFQRVRVKPDEKLKADERLKTTGASKPSGDQLWDLSSDFDFNMYSNGGVLLPDLGNSQMSSVSSIFRKFSDDVHGLLLKDEQNANYKTVGRGAAGVYSCELCPFLCLDGKTFLEHKERNDHAATFSFKTVCVGCENVFYSMSALRVS